MCKADVRKGLEDGLAMRMSLSEPREIYKDKLETDNRSNVGSEFNFEIDLPGKRDRSTIYRLNLIKLYRRKPELANLVMEKSSEGIDSEILHRVSLRFRCERDGAVKPYSARCLCCVKGILGTGGVMDKCVQMWTRNYGAWARRLGCVLACDAQIGRRRRRERERREIGRKENGEDRRDGWRKGLSPEIGVKKTMNAGGVENGNMNCLHRLGI
ncbi:uncharacterized protein TNCV_3464441 [Trichonephila clavipes]|nr:uncharacterized protein TNCV_3464441 [Trichonephila clavipes]